MNKTLKAKAIIFDIGDTLIGATDIAMKALQETAEQFLSKGIINNKEDFVKTYNEIDKKIQGPRINHLFSDVEIISEVFTELGSNGSLQYIELFLAIYRDCVRKKIRKNTKMTELFETLRSLSFKLGVITDGSTTEQTEQLHRIGILETLSSCITSEYLNVEKPNRYMFEKSLEELNIEKPFLAVMVGNDLTRDIKGAQDVGMKTALVTKYINYKAKKFTVKPDIIINSVYELPKYLEYTEK